MTAVPVFARTPRLVLALASLLAGALVTYLAALLLLGGRGTATDVGTEPTWTVEGDTVAATSAPAQLTRAGAIVLAAHGDVTSALDPATGQRRWSRDLGLTLPAAAGPRGDLLAVADGEVIRLVDVVTGQPRWEAQVDGSPVAVAAADDAVYVVALGGPTFHYFELTALDAASGELRWRQRLSEEAGFAATALTADDGLWVVFDRARVNENFEREPLGARVVSLDPRTGTMRWTADTASLVGAARRAGRLLLVPRIGGVVALDVDDGTERWRWEGAEREDHLEVTAGGSTVVVSRQRPPTTGTPETEAIVIDLATGDPGWTTDRFAGLRVAVDGDRVYVATADDSLGAGVAELTARDAVTGGVRWSRTLTTATPGFPLDLVVGSDGLIVSESSGVVHGLDPASGADRWLADPTGATASDAGPLVTADTAYVVGQDGGLTAIDTATGDERWRTLHSTRTSPLATDGGHVYGLTGLGVVRAYDVTTGTVAWRSDRQHDELTRRLARPAAAGAVVGIVHPAGMVLGLDAMTGEERWVRELPSVTAVATVTASTGAGPDGVLVAAGAEGTIVAFDAASGTERWRLGLGEPIRSGPHVAGATVVVVVADGTLVAVDGASGTERWRHATGNPLLPVPATDGEAVYFASGTSVTALDAATGVARWNADLGTPTVTAPAVGGGRLVVGRGDFTVAVLSATSGGTIQTIDLGQAVAAVGIGPDGTVVASAATGELRAFR